ncbi:MotA/TolQ/ExbB proton channel family protein [Pseudoalteromonas mariniglutinosa]
MKLINLLCFALLFVSQLTTAATANDAKQQLLTDIKSAQSTLNKSQQRITKQQTALAQKIFDKQQALKKEREQAAINRRLADEDTLSLTQLQTRLDTWQQQQQYRLNLLNRFTRQYAKAAQSNNDQQTLLNNVFSVIKQQTAALYPQFKQQNIVLKNGELTPATTLQVGPVAWFSVTQPQLMGLLATTDPTQAPPKVALVQSTSGETPFDEALSQLSKNSEKATVSLTFDPSLTRLAASQAQQEGTVEHLEKGGLWAIPIILFACFALLIALFKAYQLFGLSKIKSVSALTLQNTFNAPEQHNFSGMQATLFKLSIDNHKGQIRDDQLFNQLMYDKHKLDNYIGAIAITASVAPLLGLLGTVSGMIETFKMMTLFGSGDPEVVSGGIAQALITTELGLVVAIPALVLNALLSRKAKAYYSQLEAFALQLSQLEVKDV